MPNLDTHIITSCTESWEEEFIGGIKNKNNCSGFLKSVAKKLGIPLPATANADDIVDTIEKGWRKINSGIEAAQLAATGTFVVAGLKGNKQKLISDHGHVAIVVGGKLYKEKYPAVWGGSLGGAQSKGTKSVGEVWSRADRDNVVYYAYIATAPAKNN